MNPELILAMPGSVSVEDVAEVSVGVAETMVGEVFPSTVTVEIEMAVTVTVTVALVVGTSVGTTIGVLN
jgi:hypothetical protein